MDALVPCPPPDPLPLPARLDQATARQAARILSERSHGLVPDPWLLTRDDLLGPRELDVSTSTALQELRAMRGLKMIKDQVGWRDGLRGSLKSV